MRENDSFLFFQELVQAANIVKDAADVFVLAVGSNSFSVVDTVATPGPTFAFQV